MVKQSGHEGAVKRPHNSTPRTLHDGRSKYPIIEELRDFMRSFGFGAAADVSRQDFATRCGTSVPYLLQLGLGYRKASLETAFAIDKHSDGHVPAEVIRPDADWQYVRLRAIRMLARDTARPGGKTPAKGNRTPATA